MYVWCEINQTDEFGAVGGVGNRESFCRSSDVKFSQSCDFPSLHWKKQSTYPNVQREEIPMSLDPRYRE